MRKKLRYVVKGGLMKQEYAIADSSGTCTCTYIHDYHLG